MNVKFRRLEEYLVPALWAALGIGLASLLAGRHVVVFAAAFALLVGLGLVVTRPSLGMLLLIAGTSTLSFRGHLPGTDIESVHLPDFLLVGLFGLVLWRAFVLRKGLVWTPQFTPLLCLFLVGLVLFLAGHWFGGMNLYGGLKEFKVLAYYLTALLVPNLVMDRDDLKRLVHGCWALAGLIALAVCLMGLRDGGGGGDGSEAVFYTFSQSTAGSEKILILWCAFTVTYVMVMKEARLLYIALLALCGGYFVLMFHRHMYGAFMVLGASLLLFGLRRYAGRVSRVVVAGTALLLVLATLIAWGPPVLGRYAALTFERFASLQEIASSHTVRYRELESEYALRSIAAHPLTGVGFYTPYRPRLFGPGDGLTWFVHNGYLWILVKMGLLGLAPFLWAAVLFVRRAARGWRRTEDPFLRGIVLGSLVFSVALALVNIVSPYFMQDWGVATIGLAVGLNETIYLLNRDALPGRADPGRQRA